MLAILPILITLAASLFVIPSELMAAKTYFVVAEHPGFERHNDSYLLALDKPADIEHANRLIEEGPAIGGAIVVAGIEPGADGINRNVRSVGAPEWSWHIAEFQGFADLTVEILDGWPTFVEDDVNGWIANTGGAIGFWGYTIVDQLPHVMPGDADLDLDFDNLDLVQVLQRAKYLTGAPATWGDGDWNGGTGGSIYGPPTGNGLFDQADIIAALNYRVERLGRYEASGLDNADVAFVPEPSTLVLLLLCLMAFRLRFMSE